MGRLATEPVVEHGGVPRAIRLCCVFPRREVSHHAGLGSLPGIAMISRADNYVHVRGCYAVRIAFHEFRE